MKRNLYFKTCIRRENVLKSILVDNLLGLTSWPRLILEVFIRRNFGQRYFSLTSAMTVAVLMLLFPIIFHRATSYGGDNGNFWSNYTTWYLFQLGFLFFAWQRWQEVKHKPSMFDFSKYSLYAGDINRAFHNVRIAGKNPSIRTIETLLEPALFFALGLVLMLIGQKIGVLLLVCSILYSLGYRGAYLKGDNFIMDKIDEIIMNEEMINVFVNDMDAAYARGVRFYMEKPTTKELRKKVTDAFTKDDRNASDDGETMAA